MGAAQFVNRAAAWTITGNAGTWLPPTASFGQSNPLPSPFDGKQVLFFKSGASVSQTLGNSQLVPDSQFSLQVVVGWRQDSIPFPTSVTIELLAAPTLTVLATQTVTTASLGLSPGQSTTVTLSHSTNYGDPTNGQELRLRFIATGPANAQAAIDHVRLTFTPPVTTSSPSTPGVTTVAFSTTTAPLTLAPSTAEPGTTAEVITTTPEVTTAEVTTTELPTTVIPTTTVVPTTVLLTTTAMPPTTAADVPTTTEPEDPAGLPLVVENPSFENDVVRCRASWRAWRRAGPLLA